MANDLVWEHFAATMKYYGKNPLAEAFCPYDWYMKGKKPEKQDWYVPSMPSTPELDLWAESVRTQEAEYNAHLAAKMIQNEQQRQQSLSDQLMNLNNEREIIDLEISALISKNGGVDVIYQHFIKTMTERGKNPLAFVYNQMMWYIGNMRNNI